ncbi:hypothetical protein MNV49_001908 [Pseudohyphozyma bogoriensis]|nr:hypothetical protein MNV49_001908 [Pseudohyphozyma bogoriensis]
MLKLRAAIAWAASMAVELLDGDDEGKHELTTEEKEWLQRWALFLTTREASTSVLFPPVSDLLAAPNAIVYDLLTRAATNPHQLATRAGSYAFWGTIREMETYLDEVWVELLGEGKESDRDQPEDEGGRLWGVLRRVFGVEMWIITVGLAAERCLQIRSGIRGRKGERFGLGYGRMARKLGLLLGHSKTLSDVFLILHLFTMSIDLLGPALVDAFDTIPVCDQDWLIRAFRFAGFWDAQAGKLVDTLMERQRTTTFDYSDNQTATLQAAWQVNGGSGVIGGDLSLLENGDGTAFTATNGSSSLGVLLFFNESTAANETSTPVPFLALVSCDANYSSPASVASTNASAVSGNSTMLGNSTVSAGNGTMLSNGTITYGNGTTSVNTTVVDIFTLAAARGAVAAILYSNKSEVCVLNEAYLNGNYTKPLPIYAPSSASFQSAIISSLDAIGPNTTIFNSTTLNSTYLTILANRTSALSSGYVLTNLTLVNPNSTNSSSGGGSGPTYATVGPAPTSTAIVTTSSGGGTTSGAGRIEMDLWARMMGPVGMMLAVAGGCAVLL